MSQWPKFVKGEVIPSPLKTADFLSNGRNILQRKFTAKTMSEAMNHDKLDEAFEWLVCHYVAKTQQRLEECKERGLDDWTSKNQMQMFFARTLSLIYAEVRHVYDPFFFD